MLIDQILYNALYHSTGGPEGRIYRVCSDEYCEIIKDVNKHLVPLGLTILYKDDIFVFVGRWRKMCLCDVQ